jgi:hypothetical protein
VLDRHAAREPFISPYLLIIRTKGFNPHFSQGIYYGGGEAHDYGVALEKSAQRSYCCASALFPSRSLYSRASPPPHYDTL